MQLVFPHSLGFLMVSVFLRCSSSTVCWQNVIGTNSPHHPWALIRPIDCSSLVSALTSKSTQQIEYEKRLSHVNTNVYVNSIHIGYILQAYNCAKFHKDKEACDNLILAHHPDHYLSNDFNPDIFRNNRGQQGTMKCHKNYLTAIFKIKYKNQILKCCVHQNAQIWERI